MEDIEKYTTKNLNLAAFLYSAGLEFCGSTRIGKEVSFNFSPKERAESLIDDYFKGTAKVNPRELFAKLNDLKDLIFSGGTSG